LRRLSKALTSRPCASAPTSAFQPFQPAPTSQEPADLMIPQIVFVLCQCLTLALGLWKCNQMGIIPRGAADWLAFESRNPVRSSFTSGSTLSRVGDHS
jgi:hypothetical protein